MKTTSRGSLSDSTIHEAVFSVVFISVRQNNFKSPYSTQGPSLSQQKNLIFFELHRQTINDRYTRCYLYFFDEILFFRK